MVWLFTILGLLVIGAGNFLGGFLIHYAQGLRNQPTPVESAMNPDGNNLPSGSNSGNFWIQVGQVNVEVTIAASTVQDRNGREGKIAVIILSKEASWAYESSDTVLLNGKPISMIDFFRSEGMQSRFEVVSDVIAVGAASEQGAVEQEESRAQKRANQLVQWLRHTVTQSDVNISSLNMGRFLEAAGRSPDDTADQRRVVIVGVLEKEAGLDLQQALHDGLESNRAWPYKLSNYSKFLLEPAT